MSVAPRVLIVVGADTGRDSNSGPRRDYAVLANRLAATISDLNSVKLSRFARALRALVGVGPAQAWVAFRGSEKYDVILTDGERVGIPLALLLRFSRAPVKHITIGHRLSAPKKRAFFRILRAHARMDRIVVHSVYQKGVATSSLGIEAARVALLPYHVDTAFWSPAPGPKHDLIVSAGLEFRDYPTLFRAVDGLPVRVVVGAASPWSQHISTAESPPPNVAIGSFGYSALRELYARAAFVVVPLVDIDNQAGVTTILEAMAMGKAVITTQSLGQTDVVEDRRSLARGVPRPRPIGLVRMIAAERGIATEPTGFYVPPADATALRRAIIYLLDHPDECARLGAAGRRLAERLLTIDSFADRISDLVGECLVASPETDGFRRPLYG